MSDPEWSLWLVVTDRLVTPERRPRVTAVARQVMVAHWPRTVDGCRPCGLPNCRRAHLARTWLESISEAAGPEMEL